MVVKTLGKILMTPKGEWDKSLKYEKLDIVKVKFGKMTSGYIASAHIPANTDITDFRWINLYDVKDGDATSDFEESLTKVKIEILGYVGNIPESSQAKDVVSYIQEAIHDNIYDDTEIINKIHANTQAINVLNGTSDGSVKKIVTDEVNKIIDNAPENRNTLKKISDWINLHVTESTELGNQVNANKNDIDNLKLLIGTLPPTAESTDLVHYIAEYVSNSIINPDLSAYVKTELFESAVSRIDILENDVSILKANEQDYEVIPVESITSLF